VNSGNLQFRRANANTKKTLEPSHGW